MWKYPILQEIGPKSNRIAKCSDFDAIYRRIWIADCSFYRKELIESNKSPFLSDSIEMRGCKAPEISTMMESGVSRMTGTRFLVSLFDLYFLLSFRMFRIQPNRIHSRSTILDSMLIFVCAFYSWICFRRHCSRPLPPVVPPRQSPEQSP